MKRELAYYSAFQEYSMEYYLLLSHLSNGMKKYGIAVIVVSESSESQTYCYGVTNSKERACAFLKTANDSSIMPSNFADCVEDWFIN